MTEIETKIKALEKQNKRFYKQLKELEKKTFRRLWLWNFLPVFGSLIWFNVKYKRMREEPYFGDAVKIKVEIAKNEMEIIKLKRQLNSNNSSKK